MFFSKTDSTDLDTNDSVNGYSSAAAKNAAVAARNAAAAAQAAAQNAAVAASNAAQNASGASQTAMMGARKWAAPQLESFADYCTTTIAPMVDSALRSTATRVRPVEVSPKRRVSPTLTWSLLAGALVAALGAAAALVRVKYRSAMATDTEEETVTVTTTTTEETVQQTPSESTTASGDTSVNGRVSATGW